MQIKGKAKNLSSQDVNIDEQGGLQVGFGQGKPVEHRVLILDSGATANNNLAVTTSEVTRYTFNESDNRRNYRISFISDPSNNANGPMGVAFVINAGDEGDDVTAASRLSLLEGDVDDRAFRIGRGNVDSNKVSSAIFRIDLVGLLPGGTPTYANDLIQLEIW